MKKNGFVFLSLRKRSAAAYGSKFRPGVFAHYSVHRQSVFFLEFPYGPLGCRTENSVDFAYGIKLAEQFALKVFNGFSAASAP